MTMTEKPRFAAVLVLGLYHKNKFKGFEPTLFGQHRGMYEPGLDQPLAVDAGGRSLFRASFLPSDKTTLMTAVRCAAEEFRPPNASVLTKRDFEMIAEGVETPDAIYDVFRLTTPVKPGEVGNGAGNGLLVIPLRTLPRHVRDGHLTNWSVEILKNVDIEALYELFTPSKVKEQARANAA